MDNKNFAEQILHKIETAKIEPKARWRFVVAHTLMLSAGFLALVIGSFAVAGSLFVLSNSDFDVYRQMNSLPMTLFKTIPLLWIISLLSFVVIADIVFKHTEKGYRYPLWMVVFISVGFSCIGGTFLYAQGIGHLVEDRIGRHVPLYTNVYEKRMEFWNRPEEGYLVGIIDNDGDADGFFLTDVDGTMWTLSLDLVPPPQKLIFNHASSVALVGFRGDDDDRLFIVCAARPWVFNGIPDDAPSFGQPMKPLQMRVKKHDLDMIREELHNNDFSERNLFEVRQDLCKK